MKKALKVVSLSVLAVFVLLVLGDVYLIWKFNRRPKRPDIMPENAIWIEAPSLPIQFTYRGDWLGCWTLAGVGVQCAKTDWDGTPEYGDIYVPCDDPKRLVSEKELRFAPMDSENVYGGFIYEGTGEAIPVVRLIDGTTLLPVTDYDNVKEYLDRVSRDFPSRGCQAAVAYAMAPDSGEVGTKEALTTPINGVSPVRAGVNGIGYPKCIYCPDLGYSKESRLAGTEGLVVLQVVVQVNGKPTNIEIIRSLRKSLDESAADAVQRWRFKPAFNQQGIPVATATQIEVTFRLLK